MLFIQKSSVNGICVGIKGKGQHREELGQLEKAAITQKLEV